MRHPRRLLLLLLVVGSVAGRRGRAQEAPGSVVFPPTAQEYDILWRQLEDAARSGDWAVVARGLRRFADLVNEPDVNSVVTNAAGMSLGVRRVLKSYVDRLPRPDFESFKAVLDATLRRAMESVSGEIRDASRRSLRHRILRDYPWSGTYREVLEEEIDDDVLDGRWREVDSGLRVWLDRYVGGRAAGGPEGVSPPPSPPSGETEARVRAYLLLLEAARNLGDRATWNIYQGRLSALLADWVAASREDVPPELAEAARRVLGARLETPPPRAASETFHGLVGTRATGREAEGPPYRLGGILWRRPANSPELSRFVVARARARDNRRIPLADVPHPFHPSVTGSVILLQHDQHVSAFDVSSNRELWSVRIEREHGTYDVARIPLPIGERVVVATAHSIQALSLKTGEGMWRRFLRYEPEDKSLAWSPEEGSEETSIPAEIFSPPARAGSGFVVGVGIQVETETRLYLARLDEDGDERWRTFLGSCQSPDPLGMAPGGSPPLVTGGHVYYLTNRGILAALDAEDGVISWISEYPTLSARGLAEAITHERRWHVNPILRTGAGDLLFAPQDSSYLMTADASTGMLTWRFARRDHSTLLGRSGTLCYLSGPRLAALHVEGPERGRIAWHHEIGNSGTTGDGARPDVGDVARFEPRGRGFIAGNRILLSSQTFLVHVDKTTGRTVGRDFWDFSGGGGNLLLVDQHLAVIHSGGCFVANAREDEERRLDALGRSTAPHLLARAQFHLRSGELAEAVAVLGLWARGAPPPPAPNSDLDRLHLELAELIERAVETLGAAPNGGEENAHGARPEATALLRFRVQLENELSRKVRAAIELAEYLARAGELGPAVEALHQALAFDHLKGNGVDHVLEGNFPVPARAYVLDRIRSLRQRARAPKTTFAAVEREAARLLTRANTTGTLEAYREIVALYPFTAAASGAYRQLAIAYLDRGESLLAANTLEEYLQQFPEVEERVRTELQTADLYYQSGHRADAKRWYLAVLELHGDERVDGVYGMRPGERVRDYVVRRLADPGLADVSPSSSPGLRFPVRMAWRSPADLRAGTRTFLLPDGPVPPALHRTFFTQSGEAIDCRSLDTGLPLWTVITSMIPGFIGDPFPYGFNFALTGSRAFKGTFVGSLLIVHDRHNILAIDTEQVAPGAGGEPPSSRRDPIRERRFFRSGGVRWHVPIGDRSSDHAGSRLRSLGEQIRGVLATDRGVFVTAAGSLEKKLYAYNLLGEKLWEVTVGYDPAPYPPILGQDEVFVVRQRPAATLEAHRLTDGERVRPFGRQEGLGLDRLVSAPAPLPGGHVLMPYSKNVQLLDLAARQVIWSYAKSRGSSIQGIFRFEENPREVVVVVNRANNWPAVVGVSLPNGSELWSYEKFPARATTIQVLRSGRQLFVLYGQNEWKLVALDVRSSARGGGPPIAPSWADEIVLGKFYTPPSRRRLHVTEDSVIFPDPHNSIAVYDRFQGTLRSRQPRAISRFLVEKDTFTSEVIGNRLVLLTDGGDCAFETAPEQRDDSEIRRVVELVRAHTANPGDVEPIVRLAMGYFRDGDLTSAITILDGALSSEAIISTDGRYRQEMLGFLLEGIKQEAMKRSAGIEITARSTRHPPAMDGEMHDGWNFAERVLLGSPRHVNTVPSPAGAAGWDGEEDLSAVLYTAWDDEFFYFALDVEDDILRAFDREAEYWKGDCLVIGLDPEGDGGYRQHHNDQLMTLALTIPKRNKVQKDGDEGEGEGEDGEGDEKDEDEDRPDGKFSVKRKDDNSGTVYEVALPWSTFGTQFEAGAPPPKGFRFGLSLLLTDDDTTGPEDRGGVTKSLSLTPCHLLPRQHKQFLIWKHLIPEFFPKVVLR